MEPLYFEYHCWELIRVLIIEMYVGVHVHCSLVQNCLNYMYDTRECQYLRGVLISGVSTVRGSIVALYMYMHVNKGNRNTIVQACADYVILITTTP